MDAVKSGIFIKQCRTEKGLTQKQLADILCCTDKAISRWETGKGFPEISFLVPLSEALEVSVNEIILGERIEKEMIVKKSDEIIVQTMNESNRKIKKSHCIIFVLLVLIEAFVFYVPSLTAQPGDEMGVIFLNFIGVAVCSLILGFTNIKFPIKFIYLPITIAMFIPSTFVFFNNDLYDYALPYSTILMVLSAVLILVGSGITKLIVRLNTRRKSQRTDPAQQQD